MGVEPHSGMAHSMSPPVYEPSVQPLCLARPEFACVPQKHPFEAMVSLGIRILRHDPIDSFPLGENFKNNKQDIAAIKQRDLPLAVYKIISKLPTHSKFEQGMHLGLQGANGKSFMCMSTR